MGSDRPVRDKPKGFSLGYMTYRARAGQAQRGDAAAGQPGGGQHVVARLRVPLVAERLDKGPRDVLRHIQHTVLVLRSVEAIQPGLAELQGAIAALVDTDKRPRDLLCRKVAGVEVGGQGYGWASGWVAVPSIPRSWLAARYRWYSSPGEGV
jgi:hypothetical protein